MWPATVRQAATPRMEAHRPAREASMSTQPLVLVADDEPRITKLVAIALSEEGFRVVTANGGEQALQKAEEVRPDIVLLDIVMPDLDGIEVMRQLRERRPVPVILTKVWGPEYRDDLQYLRVWVSRVRRKLGAAPGEPGRIRTFQGIGYLLDVDGATSRSKEAPATEVPERETPALIG